MTSFPNDLTTPRPDGALDASDVANRFQLIQIFGVLDASQSDVMVQFLLSLR